MATEISSFVRAWIVAKQNDPTVYTYRGDGVTSLERTQAGTFVVTFDDAVDFQRSQVQLTSEQSGSEGVAIDWYQTTANSITITCWSGAALANNVDPNGFSLVLTIGDAELPVQTF